MIRHILVAIGSAHSEAALTIEKARDSGARLTAMHIVDRMPW